MRRRGAPPSGGPDARPTRLSCYRWHHDFDDPANEYPVEVWSEVGADDYQIRRIDFHADGTVKRIASTTGAGPSDPDVLSDQPLSPSEEEEAYRKPEFERVEVTRERFEAVWRDG